MSALKAEALARDNEALRAEVARLTGEVTRFDVIRQELLVDLAEERSNRNRDLRAFLACIKERDELRAGLVPMANFIVDTARHRRGCQRARCARPICSSCVCTCGLDAAMQAALDTAGPARAGGRDDDGAAS